MKIFRPLKLNQISQWFGKERTAPDLWWIYNELGLKGHNGIDFVCPTGTEIRWNCDLEGEVIGNGVYDDGCKYLKIVVKENGNYSFRFLHIDSSALVVGQKVGTGDLIAISGNSGKYTTGPHLHFDLSPVDDTYNYTETLMGYGGQIDPMPYYENIWVKDKIDFQLLTISILTKILNMLKILVGLRK